MSNQKRATSNEQRATSNSLRLVAWELTRRCNLNCVHCRAGSERGPYPGELNTTQCLELLAQISEVGKPIVILTGGEPLLREDIFDLARRGTQLGLRMVMATNGTLLTPGIIEKMKSSGIKRVSISIDGADEKQHDEFRKVSGAFKGSLEGIRLL
ncbi:MAG: radical SAM protein, partial [Desulfobacteraceae bacterium]|nr:radical SAM protein [Desulfobacteraceae bacterium]